MRRRAARTLLTGAALAAAWLVALSPVAAADDPPPATTTPHTTTSTPPKTITPPTTTRATTPPAVAPRTSAPTTSSPSAAEEQPLPTLEAAKVPGLVEPLSPVEDVSSAAAETPSISVSPDTDLEHRQEVQVSGTGFPANEMVGLSQCRPGLGYVFDLCDINNSAFPTLDGNGAFTATLQVNARIRMSNSGEFIDCTTEYGVCVIGAVTFSGLNVVATAPIGINPDSVPPPPVVTVTPSTDLAHDQEVTVRGSGFAPNDSVSVFECSASSDPNPGCAYPPGPSFVTADATGSISTTLVVKRIFGYVGSLVDCLDGPGCVVRVQSLGDSISGADVAISFDPDAPLPPRPEVTIAPDTDLVHDQQVSVIGSGFPPGVGVSVSQCSLSREPYPVCASGQYFTTADQNGAIDTTFVVKRLIGYPGDLVVDCLDSPGCAIQTASANDDPLASAENRISFDPDVPLPPSPVLTVQPSSDLVHNQLVTVTGTGFTSDAFVDLSECAESGESYGPCSYSDNGFLKTDEAGTFSTTFVVKRVLGFLGSPITDCLDIDRCVLFARVSGDPVLGFAELALEFDPDAPLPPPPVLVVTPSTGLQSRQNVQVSGTGFAPEAQHSVQQCTIEPSVFERACVSERLVQTDETGAIDTRIGVRRFIPTFVGPIDCAEPDRCAVSVQSYEDPLSDALVPISFDPNAPPAPPPVVTASPSAGLAEGDVVTVTGSGFSAGASLGITECQEGSVGASLCDIGLVKFVTADENGSFSEQFVVREQIIAGEAGPLDCRSRAGVCIIGVGNLSDLSEGSGAPLTFGNPQPPAPPAPAAPTRAVRAPRLALTGTPVAGYLEFAAISLGLGALLVLAGRKRRLASSSGAEGSRAPRLRAPRPRTAGREPG